MTCTCGGAGICAEFCAGELEAGRMTHPNGPCALGFAGRCLRCRRETHALARHKRVETRRTVQAWLRSGTTTPADVATLEFDAATFRRKRRLQRARQDRRRRRGW